MATFSDEEAKDLASIFSQMGAKPRVTNSEEMLAWMKEYIQSADPKPEENSMVKTEENSKTPVPSSATLSSQPVVNVTIPEKLIISPFSGGAKDTAYDLWKYEVDCWRQDSTHSEPHILKAVRKSLRGEAARVSMRLGASASLKQLVDKLDDAFGLASKTRHVMKEFYSASQLPREDIMSWSYRLAELFDQAKKLGKVDDKDANDMLCDQFWSGLRPDLQAGTEHKFDSIKDFDKLRLELRIVEQDRKLRSNGVESHKSIKMAVGSETNKESDKAVSELKDLITSLTSKLSDLQKDVNQLKVTYSSGSDHVASQKKDKGLVSSQSPSSQGTKSQSRNLDDVQCYYCKKNGHYKSDCPRLLKKQPHLNF